MVLANLTLRGGGLGRLCRSTPPQTVKLIAAKRNPVLSKRDSSLWQHGTSLLCRSFFGPTGRKMTYKAEEIYAKHGNTLELIAIPNP